MCSCWKDLDIVKWLQVLRKRLSWTAQRIWVHCKPWRGQGSLCSHLSPFAQIKEESFWFLRLAGHLSFTNQFRQDPLDLSFGHFYFLHHGIEEVERHLLWKFHKKIRRKSWSNVPLKLLTYIRFLMQSCTQNRPSPKVQALSRDWIWLFNRLDYLHEIWHTCSACSWLEMPQIF